MNIIWACLLLAGGLLILWKCAKLLVTGAVGLAKQLGVSPLVIGLTIVAMGTSAPEVAASIAAAVRGAGNITIGNVYGSNIANLALVGGLAALIRPISIKKQTLRHQIPVMLLVTLLLWPFVHNLYLSRLEGFLLLAVFAALILLTVYLARRESADSSADERNPQSAIRNTKQSVFFVVVGLVGLAFGADMAVRGSVFIGRQVGLSNAVIGLTIIAIGTSLPELATCVAAAVKGQHDISIGTILGSNVFNALLALGVAGVIRPFDVVGRLAGVDYLVMVIISFAFAGAAVIGRRIIGRAAGALLLCGYVAYIVYLLAYSR
ncbi:MAG: calcium/sodium antiporter [Planctomycetota bacterium]